MFKIAFVIVGIKNNNKARINKITTVDFGTPINDALGIDVYSEDGHLAPKDKGLYFVVRSDS